MSSRSRKSTPPTHVSCPDLSILIAAVCHSSTRELVAQLDVHHNIRHSLVLVYGDAVDGSTDSHILQQIEVDDLHADIRRVEGESLTPTVVNG
jgi:hypothetical protein